MQQLSLFQAVTSEIFEDIEGVEVIVDDILVWGSTVEEHDARLERVLEHKNGTSS